MASTDFSIESAPQPSRYVVGIDLGTTNSAVGCVDTAAAEWQVRTFAVPQLVAPGEVEARETLPSFHYEAAEGEFPPGALRLPWQRRDDSDPRFAVGFSAQDHGAAVPGRLIASAKSWLCHTGVDRTAAVLPWHGAEDVERLSPVEASSRYLAHIRAAWNHAFPHDPLERQEVVLTLPASFDEVARDLTVKAAARAGLPRVVMIEEPQAAFYAWIYAQGAEWSGRVQPGQKILVCDVGGGTSDFTLIRVRQGEAGKVQFHRVAVGEHLILGGDNMDLALARHVERRLAGDGKLEPRQWAVLVRSCRKVKETLLGPAPPERMTLSLPGAGSRLIGGALQVEIDRSEVEEALVEGFFPQAALHDKPIIRRSGFQEFGLPYAPDAAITRYLAAFLMAHRHSGLELDGPADASGDSDPARPDIVLFNGGVFESPILQNRLLEAVSSWFSPPGQTWRPVVLENARLDLAVAHGAAYYGMVRRGLGVRISAGLARSYYVGVEGGQAGERWAMCLAPAGVEEGQRVDLDRPFNLLIRRPVEFPLHVSSTRLTDAAGALVPVDPEQMTALPPIRTVLQAGKKAAPAEVISVTLHARLTEIGLLEVWCSEVGGSGAWKLQFDVRAATQTDVAGHAGLGEQEGIVDEALLEKCRTLIHATFGQGKAGDKPEGLVKRLAEVTGMNRQEWPPSLLRGMWEALLDVEAGRRISPTHEARWLNLTGFALRPGYGLAVDDWRVAQTWRKLGGKLIHGGPMCRAEWWILWRRIAGGLAAGQQRALADPLIAEIRSLHRARVGGIKGRTAEFSFTTHETAEVWRLLGSLELLTVPIKIELGGALLDLAPREKVTAILNASVWALGRLGARSPVYGPLNAVVPANVAEEWIRRLADLASGIDTAPLAMMELARRTDDRFRDVSEAVRQETLAWLRSVGAPEHFEQLVREGGALEEAEQGLIFGESLPAGLRIS